MMYNKVWKYSIFSLFFTILFLGSFTGEAKAQFYASSTGQNSTSEYNYYRQICPTDFILTVYNSNQYICYKFLSGTGAGYNINSLNYNYNNSALPSSNSIAGCLPGYLYSQITGQRCGSYNNNYNNNNLRGYGDIRNFDIRDGDDTSLEEGDNDAEVVEVRFDVEGGDVRLDRVEFDFEFTGDSSGQDLPWETFDEVRLLLNGEEIDSMDTSSRSDWSRESGDVYSLVFSDINEIIRENDRAKLTLEVDINSNISGANNNDISWEIFVPDNGLRAEGENGNTVYVGDDRENVSIDIEGN